MITLLVISLRSVPVKELLKISEYLMKICTSIWCLRFFADSNNTQWLLHTFQMSSICTGNIQYQARHYGQPQL